ncbi:MAG: RluA family pseudouridine synthase [bacterium]|nr:RluA family pseudouridine synthase [bacterium]
MRTFIVPVQPAAESLESYVTRCLAHPSHVEVRGWIRAGRVLVDGQPGKPGRYVRGGQAITVDLPPLRPHAARPEALPLPILHLDDQLVVVVKPAGMATHPSPGWWSGSCVNALLGAIADWPGVGGVAGPGVIHRLDRDTSGLLVFARSDEAHRLLNADLRARRIGRQYLAWVEGACEGERTLSAPLRWDPAFEAPERRVHVHPDGREAITHVRPLVVTSERSLVELRLETGRTHQIRVHMAHAGHPVVGDVLYGTPGPTLALHARQLTLTHPMTGETLTWQAPPPDTWRLWGEDAFRNP